VVDIRSPPVAVGEQYPRTRVDISRHTNYVSKDVLAALLVYLVFQRQITEGVTAGSTKG
jgi:hypothetical protein